MREYLRKLGLILKYCEEQRQQKITFIGLFIFVVKEGIPADDELEQLGIEIADIWVKLGRRLDVSGPKLREIDKAHELLSEKGFHMLKYWKQSKGTAATYLALCEALQHQFIQRQDMAETFCYTKGNYLLQCIKCGCNILVVLSGLDSESSSLGWSQDWGYCVLLLGSTIYSYLTNNGQSRMLHCDKTRRAFENTWEM